MPAAKKKAAKKRTAQKLPCPKRESLIADILSAEHDVISLARVHELKPDQLAEWILEEKNHRCLNGLRRLADIQTQVLMSRYRLVAATRLIRLATDEGEVETARKASVDLLKLDLKAAEPPAPATPESADDADDAEPVASLRDLLYANANGDDDAEPPTA